MTTQTVEISDETLASLRSRRNTSQVPPKGICAPSDVAGHKAAARLGAVGFQNWFMRQRAAGELVMSSDRVLEVQPGLSKTFCIGLFGERYYMGIPLDFCAIFSGLPWEYASIDIAKSSFTLYCGGDPDISLVPFSLLFQVSPVSILRYLSNYHYIDVRSANLGENEPSQGARGVLVGRTVLSTLDIRVA